MTTYDIGMKVFILLFGLLTVLVLGCFVVSFKLVHFVYLISIYIYMYFVRKNKHIIK